MIVQANSIRIPLADNTVAKPGDLWYNSYCLDEQIPGRFAFKAPSLNTIFYCGQSAPYQVDSRPAVRLGNDGNPGKGRFVMVKSNCKVCGKEIIRNGGKAGVFCSLKCKGEWQREQKPVDKEWLYQKYVTEGLSTYQIGEIANSDPKSVYRWLVDYDIPTRPQYGDETKAANRDEAKPYKNREWLYNEYVIKQRSAKEISTQFNCVDANILYFLKRFKIAARTTSETRAAKRWGLSGKKNPMFGKRGSDVPSWKGGATKERQKFYSSQQWKNASLAVWKRDRGVCRRCGALANDLGRLDIHHIVSFRIEKLRADLDNLILLCHPCHLWVHSNENINRDFIQEYNQKGGPDANSSE